MREEGESPIETSKADVRKSAAEANESGPAML